MKAAPPVKSPGLPVVKICGITSAEDALYAAAAGADILGLVFYEKSPRAVRTEKAAEIAEVLRRHSSSPELAGVFVDSGIDEVLETASLAGLNYIQLHGSEDNAYISRLRGLLPSGTTIIKAVRVRDADDVALSLTFQSDYVLLDAYSSEGYGGTGKRFDWTLLKEYQGKDRLFLAGGLNAENVLDAYRTVSPFALDLSSGLERSKGVKDHEKIDALFRALSVLDA